MGGFEKGLVAVFCGLIISGVLGAGTYTLLHNEFIAIVSALVGIPVMVVVYKVFA